jgi:hypothetical protein
MRLSEADVKTLDAMVGEWEADGLDGSARALADRIKAHCAPAAPHVPETCATCHEFPAEFGGICQACDCDEHGETEAAARARVSLRAAGKSVPS